MAVDYEWHKNQVKEYSKKLKIYQAYAKVLLKILHKAISIYAPRAIVQARAKSLNSFAEKCVRKAHKYPDPVNQLTDLCGARVILYTHQELQRFCQFIEENFLIDWDNSLDLKSQLKKTEFGYLSIHYVVMLKPETIADIELEKEVKIEELYGLKAEIQVRTFLQHAWADMVHDRIYKTSLKIPENYERLSARLAAILEDADQAFSEFVEEIDFYSTHYQAYMCGKEIEEKISMLEIILKNDPTRKDTAVEIAKLARASAKWDKIIEILQPIPTLENDQNEFIKILSTHKIEDRILKKLENIKIAHCPALPDWEEKVKNKLTNEEWERYKKAIIRSAAIKEPIISFIWRELGNALCQRYKDKPGVKEWQNGRSYLENSLLLEPNDLVALNLLAENLRDVDEKRACELYGQAYKLDPDSPYHLAGYLEFEIAGKESLEMIPLLIPHMKRAIKKCRSHIELGIELPRAYFTIGKLYLLMDEPDESLSAYAKAAHISTCLDGGIPPAVFDNELNFLERIKEVACSLKGYQWVKLFFELAKKVKCAPEKRKITEDKLVIDGMEFPAPFIILAGGYDAEIAQKLDKFKELLINGFKGFKGTIICSGITTAMGSIASEIARRYKGNIQLLGYSPKTLPSYLSKADDYDKIISVDSEGFNPLFPLWCWERLIANGIDPSCVHLLGINEGRIAKMEYIIALAFGAKAGIIEESSTIKRLFIEDENWSSTEKNLIQLPRDETTIQYFVQPFVFALNQNERENLAMKLHNIYRESRQNELFQREPSLYDWEKLPEHLKDSNRYEAEDIARKLKTLGYEIVKSDKPKVIEFTKEELDLLAEMEHGRWNAERLLNGWRRGPKDVMKKLSPYLLPWSEIPQNIKEYDYNTVKKIPELLAQMGYEIRKLHSNL